MGRDSVLLGIQLYGETGIGERSAVAVLRGKTHPIPGLSVLSIGRRYYHSLVLLQGRAVYGSWREEKGQLRLGHVNAACIEECDRAIHAHPSDRASGLSESSALAGRGLLLQHALWPKAGHGMGCSETEGGQLGMAPRDGT